MLPARALDVTPANDTTFDLPCQAAILIDQDSGTVLYEKNADEQRPIASITKVMTLLLTFEALENGRIARDEYVPVSEHAYSMGGSQIWLEPGEKMTLDDISRQSAFQAPMMRRWRWQSMSAAARPPLWRQ